MSATTASNPYSFAQSASSHRSICTVLLSSGDQAWVKKFSPGESGVDKSILRLFWAALREANNGPVPPDQVDAHYFVYKISPEDGRLASRRFVLQADVFDADNNNIITRIYLIKTEPKRN
jgi:hypothetical protein